MTPTYTIIVTPDSGQFSVRVPAMPGIHTWGTSEEAAIASAREAIALHLEGYRERGKPAPVDRPVRIGLGHRDRATLVRIGIDELVPA
jgi:predicted RNase H-like HicB family nuclease